jgi:hypothetical protein
MPTDMPDRYSVELGTFDDKREKMIIRKDLPKQGNKLFTVRGFAINNSLLDHQNHPRNHIYLDGAAKGPYYDKKRGIFSLDHHDDCVRQITDPTCIQALNLVRTRVISAVGNTIVGNDPDGDTVLADWALLNADLVAHDERVFRRVQPLFIVEGNIDSYGLGFEELTGLSTDTISESRQRINWLLQQERELKGRGRWSTIDFTDYTEEALRKIDRYALYRDSLDMPVAMDIHEQLPLTNSQEAHFVQAAGAGIYEVEYTILNHEGQKDCACIIYHDGKSKWTLKLTGFVNGFDLNPLWDALNSEELRLKTERGVNDKALLDARWGGGNIIGGPPRYYNGVGPFIAKERIIEIAIQELNKQISS